MIRNIIEIDREKCNGCGICATACLENAIIMKDGKAELLNDEYCDGLGNCLPACPVDAIKMIERDTVDYNEEAVEIRAEKLKNEEKEPIFCGCPSTVSKKFDRTNKEPEEEKQEVKETVGNIISSELNQWPIQIKLINPAAEYLKGADLLIAADCTAFAYGNFHKKFIKGKITLIGCPKLDDNQYYIEKISEILKNNNLKSLTVLRMSVPCCGGIVSIVKQAMLNSQVIVPYEEVIISTDGEIINF